MDYHRSGALRSLVPDEETPIRTMDEIIANISPPVTSRKINSGDTLSDIAAEYGVTMRELLRLNPDIKDPNKISAGKELHVPGNTSGRTLPTDRYAGIDEAIQAALRGDRPGIEEGALESTYPEALLPLMKPLAGLGAAGLTKGMGALAGAAPMASRAGQFGNNMARGVIPHAGATPSMSNVAPTGNQGMVKAMLAKMQGQRPLSQGGQMPSAPQVPAFAGRGPAMPPGQNQALGQGARMPWMGKGTGTPPQNNSLLNALRQGSQKMNGGSNEGIIQSLIQSANNPTLAGLQNMGRGQLQGSGGPGNIPFQELLRRSGYNG